MLLGMAYESLFFFFEVFLAAFFFGAAFFFFLTMGRKSKEIKADFIVRRNYFPVKQIVRRICKIVM